MKNIIILTCVRSGITFDKDGKFKYDSTDYDSSIVIGYFDSIDNANHGMREYLQGMTSYYKELGYKIEYLNDKSGNNHIEVKRRYREYIRNKPFEEGVEVIFRTTEFPVNKVLI